MSRLSVIFSVPVLAFALAACGSGERASKPESATTPPVSSASEAAKPAAPAPPAAPKPMAAQEETDPQAQSCLSLVGQAKFQEALPVCTAALKNNPADEELKAAYDKVKAETAKMAAASAAEAAGAAGAVESGAEGAASDAASKLNEAKQGM